jgi:hypothetical protein
MDTSKPGADNRLPGFFYAGLEDGGNSVNPSNRVGPHYFAHPSKGGNLHSKAVGRSQQRDRLAAFSVSGGFSDGGSMVSRRNDKLMFLTSKSSYVWLKFPSKASR